MRSKSMNSQMTSCRRPALAGLLLMLSASTILAQGNSFNVQGSFDGHGIGVLQDSILHATASGLGTASHIGRFTYALNATVLDSGVGSRSGVFLLALSDGDVIYGSMSGGGATTVTEYLTISGGTGRFQGATGNLTFVRVVDFRRLPAFESHSGTVMGTISIPGSNR